jgi:hypothetical protein
MPGNKADGSVRTTPDAPSALPVQLQRDTKRAPFYIRFRGQSGHSPDWPSCPILTQSGHSWVVPGAVRRALCHTR